MTIVHSHLFHKNGNASSGHAHTLHQLKLISYLSHYYASGEINHFDLELIEPPFCNKSSDYLPTPSLSAGIVGAILLRGPPLI